MFHNHYDTGAAMIRDYRGDEYSFTKWDAVQIVGRIWYVVHCFANLFFGAMMK